MLVILMGQLKRSAQIPLSALVAIGREVQTTLDQCEHLASKSSKLEGERKVVADLVIEDDLAMTPNQPKFTVDSFVHKMSATHTSAATASNERALQELKDQCAGDGKDSYHSLPTWQQTAPTFLYSLTHHSSWGGGTAYSPPPHAGWGGRADIASPPHPRLPTRTLFFLFLFFNITYSRWTSSLPSCLWPLRIFPSLPGSRLTTFYRDASSALLQLVNQMIAFYLLTFPRIPLRKKEHKSYFGKNRTHDFRTSRCAGCLLDHSGDEQLHLTYPGPWSWSGQGPGGCQWGQKWRRPNVHHLHQRG